MSTLFELQDVGCRRGATLALDAVTCRFGRGEFVGVCGLNGAGKSTLLEVMAGLLRGYEGACRYEGHEIKGWEARALARKLSFLPQAATPGAAFTVAEVVRMGRYPFREWWEEDASDVAICERAMQVAGCEQWAHRYIDQLSGGERQRVLFAAILAQQPAALLLDEPGTFIDLPHQIQMYRTLRSLCDGEGLLCVAATHDLNLAAAFCTRLLLLDGGRVAADGSPGEVFQGEAFRRVYGECVQVAADGPGGAVRIHYAF